MSGRGRGRKAAALAELLLTLAGTPGKKKRKTAAQCFLCQKLGHVAKHCSGAVACLKCAQAHDTRDCKKQKDAPCTCANCAGAHTANARSCAYRRNWRGPEKKTQKQVTTTHEEVVTCTEDVVTRRLNDVVQEAMSAFKSAMAEERAAMLAELGEARRQIAVLTQELRSAKEVPATTEDTATQTTPSREKEFATVATQTDEPAEGEATQHKKDTEAAAQEEEWEEAPLLPLPDMYSASAVTKKIAGSLRDGT
ncbi:uncharacterized protein LOC126352344 [Schistocerca gregaria]|uniref:uncharacterized protein LOC126352344 n=1 Tax=Schistocerca gregaria TaxID=7010 RepID=UPI00211E3362|nr:uncharacterized protein LOC126352344 [Schistocerca gregaria]